MGNLVKDTGSGGSGTIFLADPDLAEALTLLSELLGVEVRRADVARQQAQGFDAVVEAGGETFLIELKRSVSSAAIAGAVEQLRNASQRWDAPVPLVVVPYMPPSAGELFSFFGAG